MGIRLRVEADRLAVVRRLAARRVAQSHRRAARDRAHGHRRSRARLRAAARRRERPRHRRGRGGTIPETDALVFHASGALLSRARRILAASAQVAAARRTAVSDLEGTLLVFEGEHRRTAKLIATAVGARFAKSRPSRRRCITPRRCSARTTSRPSLEIAAAADGQAPESTDVREDLVALALSAIENWRQPRRTRGASPARPRAATATSCARHRRSAATSRGRSRNAWPRSTSFWPREIAVRLAGHDAKVTVRCALRRVKNLGSHRNGA